MGPLAAIGACIAKFSRFSGRSSRPEFWWFFAFFVLMTIALVLLVPPSSGHMYVFFTEDGGIGKSDKILPPTSPLEFTKRSAIGIAAFALFSAAWRRMQDTDRPGWYVLVAIFLSLTSPVVLQFAMPSGLGLGRTTSDGSAIRSFLNWYLAPTVLVSVCAITLLFNLTRPSAPGPNKYGPNPLEVTS